MVLHYSSVNFENLIKDLADMYTFPVSEVVLIELIANSLDAKALEIKIFYDVKERLLTVEDNGMGMSKNNFGESKMLCLGHYPIVQRHLYNHIPLIDY